MGNNFYMNMTCFKRAIWWVLNCFDKGNNSRIGEQNPRHLKPLLSMIILSQKIFGWYSRWSKDSCKSELKPSEWISSTHLISSTVAFWMARSQKILRSMDFPPSDGEVEESHGPAAFHWALRSVWRESVWNIGLSHPTPAPKLNMEPPKEPHAIPDSKPCWGFPC